MKISRTAVTALLALPTATTFAFTPSTAFNRLSTKLNVLEETSVAAPPSESVFLTAESAKKSIEAVGSPLYAYSIPVLQENADKCLAFPNAYGLTVRYAMKASPNAAILQLFNKKGIHIDASSGYEVRRAISAGIPAENISLSTQELPADFAELVDMGVKMNAW